MVSIGVEYDQIGDHENLASLPYGAGIPQAVVDLTIPVPFNDAGAMERRIERLTEEGRKPACVIMEAAMMNLGVVLPEPGYLEAVRDITRRHGIVLIFDEVKTGLTIAAGGATERWGVTPDLVTLAKALGGGTAGRRDRRHRRGDGGRRGRLRLPGRHLQREPAGHGRDAREPARGPDPRRLRAPRPPERADPRPAARPSSASTTSRATPSASAPRAASRSRPTKVIDYETFKANQDKDLSELAWLYNMNRGIFMTPGREEEWTLSVTHDDASVDAYVQVFEAMADDLMA